MESDTDECVHGASLSQAEVKDRKMPGTQIASETVVTRRQPRGKFLGSEENKEKWRMWLAGRVHVARSSSG